MYLDNPVALIESIRSAKMDVGMAIKPGTSVDEVKHLLPLLDYVLVMTVEPGFGGQSLIPNCINKVDWLCFSYRLIRISGQTITRS